MEYNWCSVQPVLQTTFSQSCVQSVLQRMQSIFCSTRINNWMQVIFCPVNISDWIQCICCSTSIFTVYNCCFDNCCTHMQVDGVLLMLCDIWIKNGLLILSLNLLPKIRIYTPLEFLFVIKSRLSCYKITVFLLKNNKSSFYLFVCYKFITCCLLYIHYFSGI